MYMNMYSLIQTVTWQYNYLLLEHDHIWQQWEFTLLIFILNLKIKNYYQGKKLQYIFSLSLLRVIKAISLYNMILRKQVIRRKKILWGIIIWSNINSHHSNYTSCVMDSENDYWDLGSEYIKRCFPYSMLFFIN